MLETLFPQAYKHIVTAEYIFFFFKNSRMNWILTPPPPKKHQCGTFKHHHPDLKAWVISRNFLSTNSWKLGIYGYKTSNFWFEVRSASKGAFLKFFFFCRSSGILTQRSSIFSWCSFYRNSYWAVPQVFLFEFINKI